ncbi:hypothetical protein Q8A67_003552 [Cirrhinus molitorella]|uniref:Uncharacterized protein n=1 Tax=Cirrhinus molitorella TaxID=172907 RepID=A0AA88Q3C5_9TELE|nr:hypothetical protein Q8A67_003552 [Cirrhinus molitorella]
MAYLFGTKLEWVLPQETCETHWEQVLRQKTWQAQTFSVENQWEQVLPQGTWQTHEGLVVAGAACGDLSKMFSSSGDLAGTGGGPFLSGPCSMAQRPMHRGLHAEYNRPWNALLPADMASLRSPRQMACDSHTFNRNRRY